MPHSCRYDRPLPISRRKNADFWVPSPPGRFLQQVRQRRPGDVFHDDEGLALVVVLDVEDRDQMRALEVHALADAPQLDLLVVLDGFQRHLAAAVADRVVDLAETAAAGRPLDRVSFQRPISIFVLVRVHSRSAGLN